MSFAKPRRRHVPNASSSSPPPTPPPPPPPPPPTEEPPPEINSVPFDFSTRKTTRVNLPAEPASESRMAMAWFCCSFHTAPEWLRDNKYILSGYRPEMRSTKAALLSIFRLHNETVNIWTHLAGFILFVGLTIYVFTHGGVSLPELPAWSHFLMDKMDVHILRDVLDSLHINSKLNLTSFHAPSLQELRERLANVDLHLDTAGQARWMSMSSIRENLRHSPELTAHFLKSLSERLQPEFKAARWPFFVFLAGAKMCLLFSTLCHTLYCISPRFSNLIWRLDYAGIVLMIACSFFPVVFYSFQCMPAWRLFYLCMIVVLGLGCLAVSMMDRFQQLKYTAFRAYLFSALGLWGLVPIGHQLLFTWKSIPPAIVTAVIYEVFMGVTYLLGVFFFVVRVPERWCPGRFDIILHSHNIFHVLVVVAAYLHFCASLTLLEWRDHQGCTVDDHLLHEFYLD